jgi:hypothetical protein
MSETPQTTTSPHRSWRVRAREAQVRAERAEAVLAYYADETNYNEEGAPTYIDLSPPDGWLGEEYEERITLDEGKLARQTLADLSHPDDSKSCQHS